MKFTMALIYALASALLVGLLFACVYFNVMQYQTGNVNYGYAANTAVLLFAIASLAFSLTLIWLENIPDDLAKSPLDKYIDEVKQEEHKDRLNNEQYLQIVQKLNQISQVLSYNNKTLNLGLERLNMRIDDIENKSLNDRLTINKSIEKKEPEGDTGHPELAKIFNDELKKTLSGLEIMQDKDNKKSNTYLAKDEEIDLEKFLKEIKHK